MKQQLRKHLRPMELTNRIVVWDKGAIAAGDDTERSTQEKLADADLLLMLFSAAFIDSDFPYGDEVTRALQRHLANEARMVPILIGPCQWEILPLFARHGLEPLPRNRQPVAGTRYWTSVDDALKAVADELLEIVDANLQDAPPSVPAAERAGGRRTGDERPQVPRHVANLCDRGRQDAFFELALKASLGRPARRPFVFVLYGDSEERHCGFVERLADQRIPRVLGLDPSDASVHTLFLEEPVLSGRPDDDACQAFRRELGNKLVDDRGATIAELSSYLHRHELPHLISSQFDEGMPLKTLRKLISGILSFWSQWPDVPPGCAVVHGLSVCLRNHGGSPAAPAEGDDGRRFLGRLADGVGGFKNHRNVDGIVLPELESVGHRDVQLWATLPSVQRFSRIAIEDVDRIYELAGGLRRSIPMTPLHKQITQLVVDRRI